MVSASRQEMVGHLLKVIKKGYNSINDIIFSSVEVVPTVERKFL